MSSSLRDDENKPAHSRYERAVTMMVRIEFVRLFCFGGAGGGRAAPFFCTDGMHTLLPVRMNTEDDLYRTKSIGHDTFLF